MVGKKTIQVPMIIQSYYPVIGGAERQLAALAPLLQARGVEVCVLTRRYPGLAAKEIVDGIPVFRLPASGPKPVAALSFTLAALVLLKKIKPDLIHAHELLSPTTTAMLGKTLWHTPTIATVLGGGDRGDLSKVNRGKSGKFRALQISQQVDAFIVLSREIDRELAEIGVPPGRRHFIPNGVDTHYYFPLSPSQKRALRVTLGIPDGPMIVYTGRFEPEKRLNDLIQIWPQIKARYPDASLVLVGTGSQLQALKEQATEGVIFAGRTDNVLPYLQSADAFVLPSAREGMSNSLLEAMATSLPVIVTSVGGALDIIEDGVNGFLVGPGDVNRLQSTLAMVLGSPETRERVGAAARRKIEEQYALTAAADRLRELYDALLSPSEEKHDFEAAQFTLFH
jgi:glycosyltransferase involved in cell wall biosynthesis